MATRNLPAVDPVGTNGTHAAPTAGTGNGATVV